MPSSSKPLSFEARLAAAGALEPEPADDFAARLAAAGALESEPADTRSLVARGADAVFTPLLPQVAQGGRAVANAIDTTARPATEGGFFDALAAIPDVARAAWAHPIDTGRGYVAGAVEGLGTLGSQFTSPGDLALNVLGPGAGRVARYSPQVARALEMLSRLASGGLAVRGAERLAHAEHVAEGGAGALELAMGAAGARAPHEAPRSTPPARPVRGALPAGARFQVTPEGQVAPMGVDVPMTRATDGSFVRAVPAEYARREVAGALPPGRDPIVTAPPPGSVPTDPSFVRGVPAAYARREVRGELPPGRNVIVTPPPVVPPDASGVRAVPAAIMERRIAGAAERPVYSSDPGAESVARVSDDERKALGWMGAELEAFPHESGSFLLMPDASASEIAAGLINRPNASGHFTEGTAGAPVWGDILKFGGHGTRPQQAADIQKFLETGRPNKNALAALAVARRRLAGGEGVSTPMLPPEHFGLPAELYRTPEPRRVADAPVAEDVGGSLVIPSRPSVRPSEARGAEPGRMVDEPVNVAGAASGAAGGGTAAAVEDFDRFARMFDDVAPAPGGEPGEAGFIAPQLAARAGGGLVGAAYGAATGEDAEDRLKRAALFGGLGVAAPSLLLRGGAGAGGLLSRDEVEAFVRRLSHVRSDEVRRAVTLPPDELGRRFTAAADEVDRLTAAGAVVSDPRLITATQRASLYNQLGRISAESAASVPPARSGGAAGERSAAGEAVPPGADPLIPSRRSQHAQGEPLRDPLAGFDAFLGKFRNPLVREGIAERLTENGGFAEQRRGAVPTRQQGQLANTIRVDVSKVLPKGTALSGEAVVGYARAVDRIQQQINGLAAKVNAGVATDADIVALQAAKADHAVVLASLTGARTEAGRALAAFRFFDRVLQTGDVNLIRDTANAPGLRGDAARLAQAFAQQPDNPLARYRWLQQQHAGSLWSRTAEWGRGYYYSNILSGVKTHERNILGNAANALTNLAVQPVAAGIDAARSAVTGAPRTVRLDEFPDQVVGTIVGFEQGLRDLAFTLRYGVSPGALKGTLSKAEAGKFDMPHVELPGGGANPLNYPSRALNAADAFFRSIARTQELYGLAATRARNDGLTGPAFADRVAELRAGATPEGEALQQQANTYAARAVFQETPGTALAAVSHLLSRVQGLYFVLPFVRTPGNITRQGLEFSPAGVLMKAARAGGRAGAQAQARAALGTAAGGALAYLAATGQISGNGPTDRAERAALMESGWRPNSVKIGDEWVSYQLFQPVSVQASIIANAFEAWREAGAKPQDAADVALQALARSANSFLDQSFLSGLSDFIEALKNPGWSASSVGARVASGLIPLSGAVRTVQQAVDPVVRSPRGIAETLKAGLPGLSEDVQPRIDRFGEVVTRPGGPLRRAADPFNTSSEVDDPLAGELSRLGVRLSLPSGKLTLTPGQAPLTPDEDTAIKQAKGRALRKGLEAVMQSRTYQRLDDEQKRVALERAISRARSFVSRQERARILRGRQQQAQ